MGYGSEDNAVDYVENSENKVYQSRILADVKRKDRQAKFKDELLFQEKQKMKERANSYAKYVKEMYKPKKNLSYKNLNQADDFGPSSE